MNKPKLQAEVILFHGLQGEIQIEPVVDKEADMVETKSGVYHIAEAKTFVDPARQKLVYAFNVDMPAKVEAANLKLLRRSVTLKQLFNFERSTGGIDWMKILPYVIIICMILFGK